jgi:hypothetical protein
LLRGIKRKAHNKGGNKKPVQRANMHSIDSYVDLDAIIEYAVMEHEVHTGDDNADKDDNAEGTDLLAYMSGQHSSSEDIRQVLAAKKVTSKQKKRQVNEGNLAPSSLSFNGDTYYLNKGETITFQGHQYTAHVTKFNYQVSQHDVTDMDYALVDRGANGGIHGDDMSILEGSERFVDVVGLAGHKVNQLQIVSA